MWSTVPGARIRISWATSAIMVLILGSAPAEAGQEAGGVGGHHHRQSARSGAAR